MLWALQYLIEKARSLQKPLSLCVGLGTSLDPHNDNGIFNNSISLAADFPGICICVSAGNEGDNKRHFYSTLNPSGDPIMVELKVGANEVGFSMELWGDPPTIYTIDITSPTGEQIQKISESLMGTREISFVFEKTVIYLDYILIEAETGKQIILMRFQNPTEGIWQFQIYGRGGSTWCIPYMASFHVYTRH